MTLPAEPVEQARARFDALYNNIRPLLPPPTDAVTTTDLEVPISKQKIRIYKPANAAGPLPVGLYIHSGGWYAGSVDHEDFLARNIAENSQMLLYSAEYRLAPENPYPTGLDDVCNAYQYMHETATNHGGDPTKKFIMGGSAGGSLTAAVALKYATNPELKAVGFCTFCLSSCEPSALPEAYKSRYTPELYSDAPMIGNDIMRQARGKSAVRFLLSSSCADVDCFVEWYAAPATDPLNSVLLHSDFKYLPPCYIAAPTKDPTHQETLFFYEECKKQGVKAELVEWVGMPHFFWTLPMLQKSQDFMRVWNEKLRAMIASS